MATGGPRPPYSGASDERVEAILCVRPSTTLIRWFYCGIQNSCNR